MIRRATSDDVPAVARILVRVHAQHVLEHPLVFRPMSEAQALRVIVPHVDEGRYAVHLDEAVDGFVRWLIHDRPETPYSHPARIAVIDEIGVAEGRRRQGIGQALLAWVSERAREAGAQRVQLDTWATNASALGAFHKAGFSIYTHRLWRPLQPIQDPR
jgi:ribosomal protein S18 acetylase RimI-like enzyme